MEGILNKHFGLARNIYIYILLALALLLLILFPVYIKEDGASATTGTANSSSTSLTLTTNHTSANVVITPNSANGTFAMSSAAGEAQFGVTTNNFTGYELSIMADDDSGNLTNTDGNVGHSIFSIDTPMTKDSFDTTTYNNRWGYKPSKYVANNTVIDNTGDSAVFLPSPTTAGTILDHTTVANSSANNYSIALGVRADYNTYAGSYTKNFTLAAIANPTTYIIDYNKNTSDTVTNMPTAQSSATSATSIALASNTPERENYNFLGWCTVQTVDSSCSGTTYQPGDTYGLDQTAANTVTLYAMWELEKFTITLTTSGGANGIVIDGVNYTSSVSLAYGSTHTISGSYNSGYEFDSWATSGSISVASSSSASTTLTVTGVGTLTLAGKSSMVPIQSITFATCPTTPTQVYDARDNEIYTVQKLADGRCWLLDNLRLDLVGTSLTNLQGKTNASDTTLYYLKNGGRGAGDNYPTSGVQEWIDSSFADSRSYSDPLIATGGSCSDSTYCVNDPLSGQWTKNSLLSYGNGAGKIGVYYNFCAASAGSYCYGNNTTRPESPFGNAAEDVCPKGWRMPTGNSDGEYYALYEAYDYNSTSFKNALRTPLTGDINNGLAFQNMTGKFWSSTYSDMNTFYSMYVLWVFEEVQYSSESTFYGVPVRCILDPPVDYTISYNKGTTDPVSNMPSTQTGISRLISPAELSNNIPSRSGYYFLGWCDTQPTTLNNMDSCPGTEFIPAEKYVFDTNSPNMSLYAMWDIFPSLAIQNVTSSTCPTTPTKVYDIRDDEVYTIQKLADGKCWLLDNLRLDLTNTTVKNRLTAVTTNASDATLNYLKNGGGTTSDKYARNSVTTTWTRSAPSDPFINISSRYIIKSYGTGSGKVGVYYNYCAASAGSYCYGYNNNTGNATEDVCPKGWRMPTGGSSGEYYVLYGAYNYDSTNFINALHAIPSGSAYYSSSSSDGSSVSLSGYDGYFWSSTYYSKNSMYYISIYTSSASVYPSSHSYNDRSASVRCVLK